MDYLALEGVLISMVKSICNVVFASVFPYTNYELECSVWRHVKAVLRLGRVSTKTIRCSKGYPALIGG